MYERRKGSFGKKSVTSDGGYLVGTTEALTINSPNRAVVFNRRLKRCERSCKRVVIAIFKILEYILTVLTVFYKIHMDFTQYCNYFTTTFMYTATQKTRI